MASPRVGADRSHLDGRFPRPDHQLPQRPLGRRRELDERTGWAPEDGRARAATLLRRGVRSLQWPDVRPPRSDRSPMLPACASGITSGRDAGGRPARRWCSFPTARPPVSDVRGGGPGTRETDALRPGESRRADSCGLSHRWQRLRAGGRRWCGRLARGTSGSDFPSGPPTTGRRRGWCRWCRQR